jgi:hypothetical protein
MSMHVNITQYRAAFLARWSLEQTRAITNAALFSNAFVGSVHMIICWLTQRLHVYCSYCAMVRAAGAVGEPDY